MLTWVDSCPKAATKPQVCHRCVLQTFSAYHTACVRSDYRRRVGQTVDAPLARGTGLYTLKVRGGLQGSLGPCEPLAPMDAASGCGAAKRRHRRCPNSQLSRPLCEDSFAPAPRVPERDGPHLSKHCNQRAGEGVAQGHLHLQLLLHRKNTSLHIQLLRHLGTWRAICCSLPCARVAAEQVGQRYGHQGLRPLTIGADHCLVLHSLGVLAERLCWSGALKA